MAALLMFLVLLPMSIVIGLLQALLIVWMWATFVVPTFGLAPLTVPIAWGIILMVGLARLRMSDMEIAWALKDNADSEEKIKRLGFRMFAHVFAIAFVWLIAWVLTFFL